MCQQKETAQKTSAFSKPDRVHINIFICQSETRLIVADRATLIQWLHVRYEFKPTNNCP